MDPASDLSFQGSNYLLTKFGALQWRCLRGRMCNKGGTAEDPNRSTRLMRCTKCKTKEMWVSAVAMASNKSRRLLIYMVSVAAGMEAVAAGIVVVTAGRSRLSGRQRWWETRGAALASH